MSRINKRRFCRSRCWGLFMKAHPEANHGRESIAKAAQVKLDRLKAASRARLRAHFGEISDRDLALIRHAFARGYHKGYYVGRGERERVA